MIRAIYEKVFEKRVVAVRENGTIDAEETADAAERLAWAFRDWPSIPSSASYYVSDGRRRTHTVFIEPPWRTWLRRAWYKVRNGGAK